MDFSLLPEAVDRSTIEQTILPAIQCLNQQLPGSNMVPRIIGFMVRASPDPNCRTAVFVNTNTWTVNTVENASELMEAVTTSLSSLSSSSPSPVLSSGGDDDIDDDDDDDDEKLGPATKESIEAMPVVKVIEPGKECSVCLGEFDVGGKAKEMPCKHVYHSACIDKWLGICGSCPICRYSLPTEEKEDDDDDDDEDDDDDDDDDDDADVEGEETTEGVAGGDGDDEH